MSTWRGVEPPVYPPLGVMGWVRAGLRLALILCLVYAGLLMFWLARFIELCAARRPKSGGPRSGGGRDQSYGSAQIVRLVSRGFFRLIGMGYQVTGTPMRARGAVVANHSSWLDIFALNACQQVIFVSKEEVARWPVIGGLAKAVGTVFIKRDPKEARAQQEVFETHIDAGNRLVFFPEGTSSDSKRVLPFKSTLFAAFFTHHLKSVMHIQPVSVVYHAPPNRPASFYGFWGDMGFAPHFAQVLGAGTQGSVDIIFHPPVKVEDFASRKDLSAHCEHQIRMGFDHAQQAAPQ